jgi:anthranilate/para-aminobenzoate synthase component I
MPIEIDAPRDVVLLAARVRDLGNVCVLRSSSSGLSFVAAGAVETSDRWVPEVDRTTSRWGEVPRWIGLLPYEAARGLERGTGARVVTSPDARPVPHHVAPSWKRFPAVAVVDHEAGRVTVVGDDERTEGALAARLRSNVAAAPQPATLRLLADEEPSSVHEDRIREALRLVAAGDLYQVNLARRLSFAAEGDSLSLFQAMSRKAPTNYGFYSEFDGVGVVGTSPELFLEALPDGRLLTTPIKGTRPRGKDASSDRAVLQELDQDEKERAELLMVIDLERNDLGRVARTGSVRVPFPPRIETHPSLFHRVADVRAELRPGVSHEQLLRAVFPSGSVTGAPKRRAMEAIAHLEASRRGLYTGAYGYVGRDGRLVLSIAIRTLTVRRSDGEAHYHTGGGIVFGSDPVREVEETRTKALQVAALLSS